jgi:hypothetical protein
VLSRNHIPSDLEAGAACAAGPGFLSVISILKWLLPFGGAELQLVRGWSLAEI